MIRRLDCGHVVDDATHSTECRDDGTGRMRHFPIGTGPGSFCHRCDLYRPCLCDEAAKRAAEAAA